jgi:hypothetical protein
MKETVELRIDKKYAHLLLEPGEGRDNEMNIVVEFDRDDPRLGEAIRLRQRFLKEAGEFFYLYPEVQRKYTKRELEEADLLQLIVRRVFEPAGEECGTVYDEETACDICGANAEQRGPLILKRGTIPKKDVARTIADELVVSERLAEAFMSRGLSGAAFRRVQFTAGVSKYYQLFVVPELRLSENTLAGVDLSDFSTTCEGEVYKCPRGHTYGLGQLSEAHVMDSPEIATSDLLASAEKLGVRRGLLRQSPLLFCSQSFRKMVEHERLTGFKFEVARIDGH